MGRVETTDPQGERANKRRIPPAGDAGSPYSGMLLKTEGGLWPAHRPKGEHYLVRKCIFGRAL